MLSRFMHWVRRRGPLCATLALALSGAACATAGQTSLATLIGPSERAASKADTSAVTISENGAVSQSISTPRIPLNKVLAASGNVYLPVQFIRTNGGPVLAAANTNLGVASPALGVNAAVSASPGAGVTVAANTPVANAAVQLNPAGLASPAAPTVTAAIGGAGGASLSTPIGGATLNTPLASPVTASVIAAPSGANVALNTPVVTANAASTPATPVAVGASTPLGGANVAIAAPASANVAVNTPVAGAKVALTPSTPVAVGLSTPLGGANVALAAPVVPAATAVVQPILAAPAKVVSPLAGGVVAPVVQGTTGTVGGLLGSVGLKLPGGG